MGLTTIDDELVAYAFSDDPYRSPYSLFRAMREHDPCHLTSFGIRFVTSYEGAMNVLHDEGFGLNCYVDDELYVAEITPEARRYADFQDLELHPVGDLLAWLRSPRHHV